MTKICLEKVPGCGNNNSELLKVLLERNRNGLHTVVKETRRIYKAIMYQRLTNKIIQEALYLSQKL